jgi:hypothetical protein
MSVKAFPSVHLNGTSRESLSEGYARAFEALDAARERLAETCPNARDYYVQGPDAHRAAMREHESRVERLTSIQNEIEELFLALEEET